MTCAYVSFDVASCVVITYGGCNIYSFVQVSVMVFVLFSVHKKITLNHSVIILVSGVIYVLAIY